MIDRSTPQHEKIKVLHLIDSGGLYGAEKVLLTLCSEQMKQGLEPTILSCGIPGEPSKAIELEAERLKIPCKSWRMSSGLNIKGMKEIWGGIHREGFTHLHSHGYKFNILLALTKKQARAVKLVTTVHGYVQAQKYSKMWLYEILDRVALKRFDWVVLVSDAMLELSAISRIKFRSVIYNGLEESFTSSALPRQEQELRDKFSFLLLAVGRLSPEKGFDILIRAVADLFVRRPELKEELGLVVYGEGALRSELLSLIQKEGLSENIFFAGYADDAGALMPNFDALVMSSLTEGLPVTLLEAARAALPVIASKVGAIPSVLGENSSYLTSPGDFSSLARAIEKMLSDEDSLRQYTVRVTDTFNDHFTSGVMANAYLKLYRHVSVQGGGV